MASEVETAEFVLRGIGARFVPYIVTVPRGEDILGRILSIYHENEGEGVCVVAASGKVSKTNLMERRLPTTDLANSTAVTYEGEFEIVRLKGLFLPHVDKMITSGINVILGRHSKSNRNRYKSEPDPNNIIKGVVSDELIAASGVDVVVGRFKVDCEMVSRTMNEPGLVDQVPILQHYSDLHGYDEALLGAIQPFRSVKPPRIVYHLSRSSANSLNYFPLQSSEQPPKDVDDVLTSSARKASTWLPTVNAGDALETIFFFPV